MRISRYTWRTHDVAYPSPESCVRKTLPPGLTLRHTTNFISWHEKEQRWRPLIGRLSEMETLIPFTDWPTTLSRDIFLRHDWLEENVKYNQPFFSSRKQKWLAAGHSSFNFFCVDGFQQSSSFNAREQYSRKMNANIKSINLTTK